ncbi:MAG TPA: site-specific DNA-methyltransferase [Devosiaceae bacterium]
MAKKQKLELTWIGKDERPKLEPRILIEDPALSHHAATRHSENDIFDNMLIKGDNLLALKALESDPQIAGKVKCVFIDPPYNTGSAFTHYDDGLEHSIWLSMMRDRLELIKYLLSDDGSLWITIDDNEAHYLKVLCDEVFGRENFVANVVWQKRFAPNSTAQHISASHDHVLVYVKEISRWVRHLLPRSPEQNKNYKNPDEDPRGPWTSGDLSARNPYSAGIYPIETPSGRVISGPPKGMYWRFSKARLAELDADKRIWWGKDGANVPRLKRFLSEVMEGIVPQTIWRHDEVGNTQEAKKEVMAAVPDGAVVFQTPKPERLLQRVLQLSTNPGDLVLDSFAGSGTTGAVAHKMGRRWIMVELGDHAETHIVPRLTKVIDGEDPGGITRAVDWKGGGGFRFYRLAPSLLTEDKYGNWIISSEYRPEMLAEAMCKHMGYTYAPSQNAEEYWNHGHSTETDFIYVTTQQLTHDACRKISQDVGPDRSLQICCKAFSANPDAFENLTLLKIPTAILKRCEWGRDDYSLNIANLPDASDDEPDDEAPPPDDLPLFASGDESAEG